MNKLQCVSAFYDIGRAKWDNYPRTSEKYINDFFSFYSNVSVDLVLFCEQIFGEYLKKRIQEYKINNIFLSNVQIIDYDFSNLYFFKNINTIKEVQAGQKMQNMANKTRSPEYFKPEYVALMWSKMQFIFNATELGLIKNNKVAWIDFGIAHGIKEYIDLVSGNLLVDTDLSDKNVFFKRQELNLSESIEYYLSLEDNVITPGGFFILNTKDINLIFYKFKSICEELLKLGYCDDDQTILSILCKNNPELVYNIDSSKYRGNPPEGDWFPIFQNLQKPENK
jgi:hypothetical protein